MSFEFFRSTSEVAPALSIPALGVEQFLSFQTPISLRSRF
jgi:hypothetical protein